MTRQHPLTFVVLSTLIFTVLGGVTGFMLGHLAPGYYRGVFENGDLPTFNPVEVGLGLGVTQGLSGGAVIGVLLVAAQAFALSRRTLLPKAEVCEIREPF